jgi:hypothetical protein
MFGLGVQEIMLILPIAVFFSGGEELQRLPKVLARECYASHAATLVSWRCVRSTSCVYPSRCIMQNRACGSGSSVPW